MPSGLRFFILLVIAASLTSGLVAQPASRVIRVVQDADAELPPYQFDTIQEAINAAGDASDTTPTTILIFPGNYSESLHLNQSNLALSGIGRGSVIVESPNPSLPALLIELSAGAANFKNLVQSLTFKSVSSTAPAIRIIGANSDLESGYDLSLQDLDILSADSEALKIDSGGDILLDKCLIKGKGLVINSSSGFSGNIFDVNRSHLELAATSNGQSVVAAPGSFRIIQSSLKTVNASGVTTVNALSHSSGVASLQFVALESGITALVTGAGAVQVGYSFTAEPGFSWGANTTFLSGDPNPQIPDSLSVDEIFVSQSGTFAGALLSPGTGGSSTFKAGPSASASASNSVAIGQGATASHAKSVAVGYNATTTESDQIRLGINTHKVSIPGKLKVEGAFESPGTGNNSVKMGPNASAAGGQSIAIGLNSTAPESESVAIGGFAKALKMGSLAIGSLAQTGTTHPAISIGAYSRALGREAISMGWYANADAEASLAIGKEAKAQYTNSMAIGSGVQATASNQIRVGKNVHTVTIPGNVSVEKDVTLTSAAMRITSYSEPSNWGNGAQLYVVDGELWVKDSSGTKTRLSTHEDPRNIYPKAKTSFADESVALPWSLHHSNEVIGKGQVVDMAKAINWVERKMQQELGKEEGQLIFTYELPADQRKTVDDYEVAALVDAVDEAGWIEVELGPDGSLPSDAWEMVEIYEIVPEAVSITEKRINWQTMKVEEAQRSDLRPKRVSTGRMAKQLRENYKFEDGRLYRRARVEDIDLNNVELPVVPEWIQTRSEDAEK